MSDKPIPRKISELPELVTDGAHTPRHFGMRFAPNRAALVLADVTSHIQHMASKEYPGWRMEYNEPFDTSAEVSLHAGVHPYLSVRVESMDEDPDRYCPTDVNQTMRVKALAAQLFNDSVVGSPEHFLYLRLELIVRDWVETHRTHVLEYGEGYTAKGKCYTAIYQGPDARIIVKWWVYQEKLRYVRQFTDDIEHILSEIAGKPTLEFPYAERLVVMADQKHSDTPVRKPLFELFFRDSREDFDIQIPKEPMDFETYKFAWRDFIDDANKRFGGDPGVKLIHHACWAQIEAMGYKPVSVTLLNKPDGRRVWTSYVDPQDRLLVVVDHLYVT